MTNLLQRFRITLERRAWVRYVLIFLFFVVVAWVLARPALLAPFFGDDFHLVRTYSADELRSVWTGPWDTDGIETAGYRPLTTIFNHLRASLLGESMVAQRSLLLLLFALFLTFMVLLARQVTQSSCGIGLLGGVLALTYVSSTYHYLWISDGVHLVGGILILIGVLLLLLALRTGRSLWLIGSWASVLLSLLVREDNLIVLPLLALFAAVHGWQHPIELRRLRGSLIAYSNSGAAPRCDRRITDALWNQGHGRSRHALSAAGR